MQTHQPLIVEYLRKPFDDPDYDHLLGEFASTHPAEFDEWRRIERQLFQSRRGLCAYPNQELMHFCIEFLRSRLVDEIGRSGPSRAWRVLRGRILRRLLAEEPALHPAPGKILITQPRTCSDRELASIVEDFRREQPKVWHDWARIEAAPNQFGEDSLRSVSVAFRRFVDVHCWVLSSTARSSAFLDARGLHHPAAVPAARR